MTTLGYDASRRLTQVTDATGQVTTLTPDAADRVHVLTRPDSQAVVFAYDAAGNLIGVTPPGKPVHQFGYTPVNLEATYTPPGVGSGGTATTKTYDADRSLRTIIRPDLLTTTFTPDTAGRVASWTTPLGTTSVTYDPTTGARATVTTPDGVALASTTDGPLVTGLTWTGPVAGTVAWTFDPDRRVATEQVTGASTVAYQYDPDGLLTGAGSLTVTRDAATGLPSGTALGVVTTSDTSNPFGELASRTVTVNGTPLLTLTYPLRDALGRIRQRQEAVDGVTTTVDYGYDLAARLETVHRDGSLVATYQYDANGNRLARITPGGTETGTVDAQDRLLAYGAATYTYTANGELQTTTVGSAVTQYTYDVLGNLRTVVLPGNTQIGYVIDGADRRIGKQVNGTLVQGFLYSDPLRVVAELDGTGALVSRFIYGEQVNVPESLERGGQTYRLVTDHLGSPRLVIDTAAGTVVQRLDYDEFGRVLVDTNPGFQPFGFAGGLYDPDTGLVRFGARDYDAATGRWTAKDPIGFDGHDLNLYAYVHGDPVNGVDPAGTGPIFPGRRIAGCTSVPALDPSCASGVRNVLVCKTVLCLYVDAEGYCTSWGSIPGTSGETHLKGGCLPSDPIAKNECTLS